MISLALPAPSGTIAVIGRDGQSCALAEAAAKQVEAKKRTAESRRILAREILAKDMFAKDMFAKDMGRFLASSPDHRPSDGDHDSSVVFKED
jgi:hypothetical protein